MGCSLQEFYGAHELLASDHRDRDIPVESIIRQCSVHSFDAYKQLQEVSDTDFYTRFHYKVTSGVTVHGTVSACSILILPTCIC